MLNWISGAVRSVASWLGSGVASLFDWLLGGIVVIFQKLVEAARGFWDVLDSLWDFTMGFIGDIGGLLGIFFPFIPPEVTAVITTSLFAILIACIVKKVRGK